MNKCQYCGIDTERPRSYLPLILPNVEIEEKVDKLGRDCWWDLLEKDQSTLSTELARDLEQIHLYMELLHSIGRGYSCIECENSAHTLLEKYYPE